MIFATARQESCRICRTLSGIPLNCSVSFGPFCSCYGAIRLMTFVRMQNNDEYNFHRLTRDEAQQIREGLKHLGAVAYGSLSGALPPEGAAAMVANIKKDENWDQILDHATCFVCRRGEELVGMAFLTPQGNPWRFFKAGWSYIRMVGVLPGHNGKGIGRKLTQLCIDHAKETGEDVVALHTSELMPAARHIYESLGFTILEEIEPFWGKRYWLYLLKLKEQ